MHERCKIHVAAAQLFVHLVLIVFQVFGFICFTSKWTTTLKWIILYRPNYICDIYQIERVLEQNKVHSSTCSAHLQGFPIFQFISRVGSLTIHVNWLDMKDSETCYTDNKMI